MTVEDAKRRELKDIDEALLVYVGRDDERARAAIDIFLDKRLVIMNWRPRKKALQR